MINGPRGGFLPSAGATARTPHNASRGERSYNSESTQGQGQSGRSPSRLSRAAPFARTKSGSPIFPRSVPRRRAERQGEVKAGSRTVHVPRRLRDTALKVVAGSRDPRENRTISHVPGGAIGNRFRRALSPALPAIVRFDSRPRNEHFSTDITEWNPFGLFSKLSQVLPARNAARKPSPGDFT